MLGTVVRNSSCLDVKLVQFSKYSFTVAQPVMPPLRSGQICLSSRPNFPVSPPVIRRPSVQIPDLRQTCRSVDGHPSSVFRPRARKGRDFGACSLSLLRFLPWGFLDRSSRRGGGGGGATESRSEITQLAFISTRLIFGGIEWMDSLTVSVSGSLARVLLSNGP